MTDRRQLRTYGAVLALGVASWLLAKALAVAVPLPGQAVLISPAFLGVFVVCFAAGVFFARRARLPAPDDIAAGRLIRPIAIGTLVGFLLIGLDLRAPAAAARGVESVHVSGPGALPFYCYGAIAISVVFHFLPVSCASWLASFVRRPRFVIAAGILVAALSEDAGYFSRAGVRLDVETVRHLLSVGANATEAIFTYRFGLLGGVSQRAATYVWWHLIWPAVA